MDTFSHAGWGYVVSKRKGMVWWGALAGAMPDLLFFIPSRIEILIEQGWSGLRVGNEPGIWRADGPPLPPELVEAYWRYYVWSHSLVMLATVTALVWVSARVADGRSGAMGAPRARPPAGVQGSPAIKRSRWCWLAVPYALHILMDLPTHERYEGRPFYPLSDWYFSGVSWGDPRILIPNFIALAIALWIVSRRRK